MNQACLGQDLLCNEINFELYPFDFNKCVMNKILICHCLIMRYTMANASMLIMFIGGLISMRVNYTYSVSKIVFPCTVESCKFIVEFEDNRPYPINTKQNASMYMKLHLNTRGLLISLLT